MPSLDILGVPHAYEFTCPPHRSSSPVLIFIHGWLLSRHYWQPLIDRLSGDYPCLVYDLRGFGESRPLAKANGREFDPGGGESSLAGPGNRCQSGYSLAAYAEDLKVLVQELDIDRAWLIGHSLGGSIALWGAYACPQTVEGAICLNSGGGIYLKEEFERFRSAGEQLIRLRPPWLCYLPWIDLLFARIAVASPLERRWSRQRLLDFVRADAGAALGSLLESTTEAEVHLLPQIVSCLQQPVYFFAGEKDTVMEPKYVRHLASFHPLFQVQGNNVIEIANCGHLSMVEQPEILAGKILKILQEYAGVLSPSDES